MKTHLSLCLAVAIILTGVEFLQGAPTASQPAPVQTVLAPTPYAITTQDGNSRVWERTTYEKAPDGTIVPKKHSYTELATGLNYKDAQGRWVGSKEEIDIMPNGTAAAIHGQHQAYFPGDIYNGVIELVTPDGKHMKSRPMGLSYDDGNKTVLIAELTNSIGQVMGSNQVIYPDAFTDFKADLVYTYRKGGFEQDIVLREQPPTPESLGLNPDTARLQVLTEFFGTAEPVATPRPVNKQDGLRDTTLAFGQMKMIRGKAFSFGETKAAQKTPVYKSWVHLQGRTFLVEELPIKRIATQLEALPVSASATVSSASSILHKVSATRLLTPLRLAQAGTNTLLLARADFKQKPGVVLDYVVVSDGGGDYTFQADTTYFINGAFYPDNMIFEGGAVLKFDPDYGWLYPWGDITCDTGPDHPATFTSMNDDSVGATISGSTGSPSGWEPVYYDYYDPGMTVLALKNLRVCYGGFYFDDGNTGMTVDISDCQFVQGGIQRSDFPILTLRNVLFDQCGVELDGGYNLTAENVTANTTTFIGIPWWGGPGTLNLTNCIIFGSIDSTATLNTNCVALNPYGPIFKTAANASYYLTNGSPYRDIGTTNIDTNTLADIETMTTYAPQDGGWPDTNTPDLGYHYSVNEDSDYDGLPDWWEYKYFGGYAYSGTNLDTTGTNTLGYDYTNSLDPNVISFSFSVVSQYASTNIVNAVVTILAGVPSYFAVLVDSTNFTAATWTAYASSNITVNLGSTQGTHDVWIGLRGLPSDAQQTWEETTLILNTNPPAISITNPVNNVSFNSSRVDVSGNFASASLKQITVNDVVAFIHGTNFEALNVPLNGGTNIITAVIEDLTDMTNAVSINVIGLTNTDGSLNDPVDLSATPVAGFVPLPVTFAVQSDAPGTMQQVNYDFYGNDIAELVTNNLLSITYTYATNGEYFPVVTIQTDAGRFSSIGGWNAVALDPTNQPVQINVQPALTQTVFASITDPVDLKWMPPCHLYVLSGSGTTTITEFNTNGTSIRCLNNIGASSGFDVDAAGNVYVAVTVSNQVWKFNPTDTSFAADGSFGNGGCIGLTNGLSGTDTNEFNAPFDVAVLPDSSQISVSDSGNNRIQQFDSSGNFVASFGSSGSAVGQFNTPKGITYDSVGNLYIVDSGNNRIAVAQDSEVEGVTGTNGTALGQFSGPVNISIDERGVYIADTGNNRIQSFNPPVADGLFSIDPSAIGFAVSSGLSAPAVVAAVDNLTNEIFYVADTGNNRILLYTLPADDPTPAWINLTTQIALGNIEGALSSFSVASVDQYRQAFLSVGAANALSAMNEIGTLTLVYINNDRAEYYFTDTIAGQTITFPIEFDKENGVWKILEF
ncbi:MAG TPA: hypothetical protein VHY30_02100 [Verrucomicrobiae bacterium]|jgi:hypothetical protein|nr:hypothetical protein [Verrucomicrobiae bacterium]